MIMLRKSSSKKVKFLSFLVLIIALIFLGASGQAAEKAAAKPAAKPAPAKGPEPQAGGVLKIIEATGPKTPFGWPAETVGESVVAATPALETLVRQYYDGHIEPMLATAWKIAPDKSSITFTLRKGVKFHDGTDFDGEAVKFSLESTKAAKLPGTDAWASIEVIDVNTVKVNLTEYQNTVLSRFASVITSGMVSPAAYKTKGIEGVRWHPVGTGPFEFVSFERDVRTVYKKFSGYWQKGKPYLDGVEYIYIKDPMTQASAIQTGEAHVLNAESGKLVADLRDAGLGVFTNPAGVVCLIPDSSNADSPLADKRVREAIEYAIDKEAIAKAKSYGFWTAAYQLPPIGTMAYDKNFSERKYNVQKAKQLLAQAGYAKGMKIKILPQPWAVDRDVALGIQGYLAKVGITADVEVLDQGKFTDYRRKGWKNGFILMAIGYRPNFFQFITEYLGPTSADFPSLKKPAGGEVLLKDGLSTTNPEFGKIQKVLKLFQSDETLIPVHVTTRACVFQKNVHDTNHLRLATWPFWTPELAWLSK
jgi:peptide/nickel transport system substrate-binding protein